MADFYIESVEHGRDLSLTGEWSSGAERAIRDGLADGLVVNYARGFRGRNLDFLRGLPVKRLSILARTLTDSEPVYEVGGGLEELNVEMGASVRLDGQRLPALKRLSCSWQAIEASVAEFGALQELWLLSYSEADFRPLSALTSLRGVWMKDRPQVVSLDGIGELPLLGHLGVYGARRLATVEALRDAKRLLTIELPAATNLTSIEPVQECPGATFLDISEGATFPSAEPLGEMRELRRLYAYASTRFVSGDLTPIAQLPKLAHLRMQDRRHYRPKVAEIQALISGRA
jgi:hypothetical protein